MKNKYKKILAISTIISMFLFLHFFVVARNTDIFSLWSKKPEAEKEYIKWVDCNLTVKVLEKTSKLDIDSHVNNEPIKYNWIELISYLACKCGNNFKNYKDKDLDELVNRLKQGETMEEITKDMKHYNLYLESYTAILGEFIGEYEIETVYKDNQKLFEKRYGLKTYLPIAKGYNFNHYDDFGNSRNYGYRRVHLGNDLMGSIGTPIIAVESGIVEAARLEPIWRMENRN